MSHDGIVHRHDSVLTLLDPDKGILFLFDGEHAMPVFFQAGGHVARALLIEQRRQNASALHRVEKHLRFHVIQWAHDAAEIGLAIGRQGHATLD